MDYLAAFGAAAMMAGFLVLIGIIAFLVIGRPLVNKLGDKVGSLFNPGDDGRPARPEYSIAESQVKKGRYDDAIAEYRKVIEQFPTDTSAHVRIAQLAVERLNDIKLAELELLSAIAKASGEDAAALASHRLADLYQHTRREPVRAIEVMRQLAARLPGTKEARRAEERIQLLQNMVAGQVVPEVPTRIAFKPTDEETLRRRRGY
jgi:outer membrane protein assembly factor BamD (BamD/ComL family)